MKIKLQTSKNTKPWKTSGPLSVNNNELHVHLDPKSDYPLRDIQRAGRLTDQMGIQEAELSGKWSLPEQWAFYQGFHKTKNPGTLHFAKLPANDQKNLEDRLKVFEWAKQLINAGPAACTPLHLTHAAEDLLKEIGKGKYKIEAEYIVGEELRQQGYVGCYNVGRGSQNPPVLLSMTIRPKNKLKAPIKAALVGKGITFDSGGYVLKPREGGIGYMKCDMAGAATVVAATALAMLEDLSQPIEVILCCAENLVSGSSYLPGDVLEYKNGTRVEIINTDAEGRVVLADGLIKASGANPDLIIDAATLTGAAQVAVGKEFCALFSMDEALRERTLKYAKEEHEQLWPLPLELWHRDMIPSLVADTANALNTASASPAGSCTAAGFLSRFIKNPKKGWLHFDLANAYMADGNALWSGGATGNMINTIKRTLLKETRK